MGNTAGPEIHIWVQPGKPLRKSSMQLEQINELTKNAYNKTADKYHHHFKDEVNQKEYDRQLLDKFSAMLPINALVCDAGCGPSGHIGKYLSDKGHRVTGIDFS